MSSEIFTYTTEQADYIEKYFKIKTDNELAEELNLKESQIKKIRFKLGYIRQRQTFHKEPPEGMKWCWYCNAFHELDEFSNNKSKHDGKQDECKKAVKLLSLKRKNNKNKKTTKFTEKTCSKCGKSKSIDNFVKNASTKDGYSNLCIDCLNEKETIKKFKIKKGEK